MILCLCGCAQPMLAAPKAKPDRRYLPGHNPRPRPNQDRVLDVLADGPLTAITIARRAGLGRFGAYNAIRRLRDRGLVRAVEGGRWGCA